jgi:LDH2 family malate/lactate/ureidoglycolate dehydrogenase
MGPAEIFRRNVSTFAEAVRSARPVDGGAPVRMPFDRSRQEREKRRADDAIEAPDELVAQLRQIAERAG